MGRAASTTRDRRGECRPHVVDGQGQAPRRLVVAIAVAPPEALARLRGLADEVVCLHSPALFGAVGEFFDDFSEVSDLEAIAALDRRGTDPAGGTTPPS